VVPPDLVEAEVEIVHPVVDLLQADIVLLQGIADEDLVAKHADSAVAAYPADQKVGRVVVGLDAAGHGSGGGAVELGRPLHVQALVRAEVVGLLAEVVELALLGREAAPGRDGGIPLERAVHPLVHPVLLRLPRLDQLGVDPKLDTCTCAASAGVNHTDSVESRARAPEANGEPLSVRIRLGSP